MRDMILQLLDAPVDHYLEQERNELGVAYQKQLKTALQKGKQIFAGEIASYVDNSLSAMAGEIDQETLLDKQKELHDVLKEVQ
jgi:hypothetical protein